MKNATLDSSAAVRTAENGTNQVCLRFLKENMKYPYLAASGNLSPSYLRNKHQIMRDVLIERGINGEPHIKNGSVVKKRMGAL